MSRTFLVQPGRTVTLPQGLQAGPGATNMRLPPGAVVTLEDDACEGMHSRFIAGRLRADDWVQIDPKDVPADPTPAVLVPDPYKPSVTGARPQLETGKKER